MRPNNFIPLHAHSIYSFMDGVIKIPDYVRYAQENSLPAIALTDHGAGYGIPEFVWECEKHGIKPIVGAEVYVTPDFPMEKKGKEYRRSNHLTLLCKNQTGYQNLLYLLSVAQTEGFYYVPRVDKGTLAEHSEGIIALSGCISGEIPSALRQGLEVSERAIRETIGSKRARNVFETTAPIDVLKELMEERSLNDVLSKYGLSADEAEKMLALVEERENYSSESIQEARCIILEYKGIFGEDFYLEIQSHDIPGMSYVYGMMRELGEELGVERVATTDSHYLRPNDYIIQSAMSSVKTKTPFGKSPLAIGPSFHIWSEEEAREAFEKDEVDNTAVIAEQVEPVTLNIAPPYFIPEFCEEGNDKEVLREMCYEALPLKYPQRYNDPQVVERLEHELSIIEEMGFPSYFLIVADICNKSRAQGIIWTVRGSAAGSLVAYLTGITMIEPLQFNLKFERFLNPNRVNMPDVDLDYPDDTRHHLIEYTAQRYGQERVAHIGTYTMLKAKSSLKDMARILDVPYLVANRLSSMIPDGATLSEALQIDDKLRKQYEVGLQSQLVLKAPDATGVEAATLLRLASRGSNLSGAEIEEDFKKIDGKLWSISRFLEKYKSIRKLVEDRATIRMMFDLALSVEGSARQASIHAAGILISDVPLVQRVPVARVPKRRKGTLSRVTQWDMAIIDKMGMLKIDFLGLRTLSHVRRVLELINKTEGEELTFWGIPYKYDPNDPKVAAAYHLLGDGDTTGVFQAEGTGMRGVLQEVVPTRLQELADVISLYRPGPMEFIPDYIKVKRGGDMVCVHAVLGEILQETYGVCVYQEQVMQIAQRVAGFTMGEADNLRHVIAKKKMDKMPGMERQFKTGAVNNGFSTEEANNIWESLIGFARYGFNRAHATSYAVLTVITAYLKANYPWQFWAELIATESGDTAKMGRLIREAKDAGYHVTPPDINRSQKETSLIIGDDGNRIVLGLKEIKNVGDAAVTEILEARGDVAFSGVEDFLQRCPFKKVNKTTIASLAKAGCFDDFLPRAQAIASADKMSRYGRRQQSDYRQPTLFATETEGQENQVWLAQQWQDLPILEFEREVLGTFVTRHPLSGIEERMVKNGATPISSIEPGQNGEVRVVGLVSNVKKITTKRGDPMAFVILTSPDGEVNVTIFSSEYGNVKSLLKRGNILLVDGYFNTYGGRHSIVAKVITQPQVGSAGD